MDLDAPAVKELSSPRNVSLSNSKRKRYIRRKSCAGACVFAAGASAAMASGSSAAAGAAARQA
jgi:hypothetical protein